MIRAVLFDLDGTLYDRDASIRKVAREQFATFRDRLGGTDQDAFVDRFLHLDDHGYAERPELYRGLGADLGLEPSLAGDLQSHFWSCYSRHCQPFDDARSTLQALRTAGKRLGVITNGQNEWQAQKLEALDLGDRFDVVLISEAEGLRKPDPRIFARALDRMGVEPSEAMFVGDHPDVDIAGARAAGLAAAWKRVPYWTLMRDDALVIEKLGEILQACC